MATADLVIKLGGSAVTHKDQPFTPNIGVLERIAGELSEPGLPSQRIVLIYGGGSFGHAAASRHLRDGMITSPLGFAEVRSAMLSLTKVITDVFLRFGVPIFCISPSGCILLRDGAIDEETLFLDPLERALGDGLIPAMGGDVVLDTTGGARILSGDRIARLLAIKLGAKALLFGTDVDGVMASEGPTGTIYEDEIPAMLGKIGGRKGDVTGGMAGKVREIAAYLWEGGEQSLIFNITRPGLLGKILRGERVQGTYIRRRGDPGLGGARQ